MMCCRKTITLLLVMLACSASAEDEVINFAEHVRPIFQQSCFNCHNPDDAKGGLDLTSYRATMAGSSGGEVVVSLDAEGSRLLGVMEDTLSPKMPPNGGKVADDKLELIRKWIDQGVRETSKSAAAKPKTPRVDLSVGDAAIGRPAGPPIMPVDMPLGPVHHTPRPGTVLAVAGHPWSPIAAVAGQKQTLIYHTQRGELLGVLPFDHGQPHTLRFSWTGKLLIVGGGVGGQSGTVVLYDVESGEPIAQVGEAFDAVLAADLDPTQRLVAIGGPDKLVKAYSVATGEMVYKLDAHTEWITAIAYSPDGDYLATGDRNGGLRIWEADTGMPVFNLEGHRASVTSLAWRYDGKVLASAGEDEQAKLWEMSDGRAVKSWRAHGGGARSIAFDEKARLVTTGRDGRVVVWDADGKALHTVKPFDTLGMTAAFDTHGKAVVAADLRGRLVRWSLEGEAKQVDAWTSNPPPVEQALSASAAQVSAASEALKQAQAQQAQQAQALEQAEATAKQAAAHLDTLRQTVKTRGEVPATDEARRAAMKERDAARQALGQAQNTLREASNALKARQDESDRVRKDHERAVAERKQAKESLDKLIEQLKAAADEVAASPEDEDLAKEVASLAKQSEQARQQVKSLSEALEKQAEQRSAAQQKVDAAEAAHKSAAVEADRAEQMAEETNREAEAAGKAHDRARATLDTARQAIKPAEDKLKATAEQQDKAAAALAQSQAEMAAAQSALEGAERSRLKWRAAQVRLKLDALCQQRDLALGEQRIAQAQRDKAVAERAAVAEQIAEHKAALANAPATKKKQQQAIKQAADAIPAFAEALAAATKRLKSAESDLKALIEKRDALDQAINQPPDDDAEQAAAPEQPEPPDQPDLKQQRDRLQAQIDKARQTVKSLGLKREDAQYNAEDADYFLEKEKQELSALTKSLAELPGKIKAAEQEHAKLVAAGEQAERAVVEAGKPAAALQAEIDSVFARYRTLREQAGLGVIEKLYQ